MSTSAALFALSINQVVDTIAAIGHKRTVLVQGHMGSGKSSILHILAKKFPGHVPVYFDCTTKALGDISLPMLSTVDAEGCVRFITNEELGLHLGQPIILMIDEFGKAKGEVKNALMRLMLERKMGSYVLPQGSIIFCTTNLGSEGVGDLLMPHHRNRITILNMRKSTNYEWIEWGIGAGIEPLVLGAAKEYPDWFVPFDEVKNPDDNPYIYHPQQQRAAFVTPRSLEGASEYIKIRHLLDTQTLTAALIGTVGEAAAMQLMTFISVADQLPKLDEIRANPRTAKVPDNGAAVAMVVYRTLAAIERDWVDQWMDYMERLDMEAQALFGNNVRSKNYEKRSIVMGNAKFRAWSLKHNYLYTADDTTMH